MASPLDPHLSFVAEWFDDQASLIREYTLLFYLNDGTLEMIDRKTRRKFLKRIAYADVQEEDLFLGATITVYGRLLTLASYGDDHTRSALERAREHTCAIVLPDAYNHMGKIMDEIYSAGFVVAQCRMFKLSTDDAAVFYAAHSSESYYDNMVDFITTDAILVMDLVGEDAVRRWQAMCGPVSRNEALDVAPDSLRARFGHNDIANAVHASDSDKAAAREIAFFFDGGFPTTACFDHCSLVLIKPHAMLIGDAGKIVDAILAEGYEVSAMQQFLLDPVNAEEFLEVYKGVVPEYRQMVDAIVAGPVLAMEVRSERAVESFRAFAGARDPAVAQRIHETSIRALYGVDKVKNAVHCTDLPEDGVLESEYFFKILNSQ